MTATCRPQPASTRRRPQAVGRPVAVLPEPRQGLLTAPTRGARDEQEDDVSQVMDHIGQDGIGTGVTQQDGIGQDEPEQGRVRPGARSASAGRLRVVGRDERGITTAEYAVGTAAGAGFAGLLYKLLTGGLGDQMLSRFFEHVMTLLGIG